MTHAVILPTGDEIQSGLVIDTDSPAIIARLLRLFPCLQITRAAPLPDSADAIHNAVNDWTAQGISLLILIGGSGGGSRFSSTLSADHTANTLSNMLTEQATKEIWGKNGHLWCKLVLGKHGQTLVLNLPGPYVEAVAAFDAFCETYQKHPTALGHIVTAMANAVLAQYPT